MIAAADSQDVVTGVTRAEHSARQHGVEHVFARISNATLLDPADYCFDEAGRSIVGTPDVSYYSDLSHLSTIGSMRLVQPLLEPVFESIGTTAVAGISLNQK